MNKRLWAPALAFVLVLSLASGQFARVQPQSEGKSGVNADTVDGLDASDLGGQKNLSTVLELGNEAGDQNINMSGNAINNIGKLQDCGPDEFVNGAGECTTDSFSQDTDNQDLQDVLAQGNSAGSYSIDLNGNKVTDSTGSTTLGGNVVVPDGGLRIDGAGNRLTLDTEDASGGGNEPRIDFQNTGSSKWQMYLSSSDNLRFRETGESSEERLRIFQDGPVEVVSGDLEVREGNLEVTGSAANMSVGDGLKIRTNTNQFGKDVIEQTQADPLTLKSTAKFEIRSDVGSYGSPFEIYNQGSKKIRIAGGGPVEVRNTNLDVHGNNVTSSDGEMCIGRYC